MTQKLPDKLILKCLINFRGQKYFNLYSNLEVNCDWLIFYHDGLEPNCI